MDEACFLKCGSRSRFKIDHLLGLVVGILFVSVTIAQSSPSEKVNVFLGTSGDHGQLSPSASTPFNMMSLGPQTTPHIHTGYEYYAKEFEGFTHTRIEGVGCTGSGGNILIKPILNADLATPLIKTKQRADPGHYSVDFENGIRAALTVDTNFGFHEYTFPTREGGLLVDLGFALSNRFIDEEHGIDNDVVSGFIDTYTTCHRGRTRLYFAIQFPQGAKVTGLGNHKLIVGSLTGKVEVKVGFSSVSVDYATKHINNSSFSKTKKKASDIWKDFLGKIEVKGEQDREDLFYSLLYRSLQSPFLVSEKDGAYRAIDGSLQKSTSAIYNGWAIWDNYREQLPLLSLAYAKNYQDIINSIANLYNYGKKDWATDFEPSLTVRSEHAIVVLLDAYKKGYVVDFKAIKAPLLKEAESLDFGAPDKTLESSYDLWAMSEILRICGDEPLSKKYAAKADAYKTYWNKDFKDMDRDDVDRMQARGLYQGTLWQYRWFVPFDIKGLKGLMGGEEAFTNQLDTFFKGNYYNHANQPDLQVPGLYNASAQPWKSQKLFRELLLDTVVQTYFNDNSKGVDPYVGRIYQNKPKAYLRTMDDDAGTMSSWFVLRSMGLSAVNVGTPAWYLTAPIFKTVTLHLPAGKTFKIEVTNYDKDHSYITAATLNGKPLARNWLTHQEISQGGMLELKTAAGPNTSWGIKTPFITGENDDHVPIKKKN